MNRGQLTIRMAPALKSRIKRDAAERGIGPGSWAAHLIERGQLAESLEQLLENRSALPQSPTNGAAGIPPKIVERLLFAACFSEAILKKLNASLNRSTSEMGAAAAQARDQAQAETAALLKALQE